MGKMLRYFSEKLFEINYRMSIHEGNANQRLASEAAKIFLLPVNEVPEKYKTEFLELRNLIQQTIEGLSESGLTPSRIRSIRNSTASKYIKLLIDIQNLVDDMQN